MSTIRKRVDMAIDDEDEGNDLEQLGIGAGFQQELHTMLSSIQLLKEFDMGEIEEIAPYTGAYLARKGVKIFREGAKGSFMCLIVDGGVEIIKGGKKVTTVRPGKTMGEMAVIDGYPHSATAIAVEDTRLIMITRNQLDNMSERHPRLAIKLLKRLAILMSLRLRQTTGVLCDYLD
ncbi:MAG: cyclic nucleotide-binding domain-containing protein [Gammaproteobacteria bacterium]|nr:cyclic nucleotide-binding domain-containing protein [Gammaproteobacteria bacterium]MCK5092012.1 cyclic nucleotide-binding domain-containing protein [Gammaproteobacteria bacterium]